MNQTYFCFKCCLEVADHNYDTEKRFIMALLIGLIVMPIMIVIAAIASIPVMAW